MCSRGPAGGATTGHCVHRAEGGGGGRGGRERETWDKRSHSIQQFPWRQATSHTFISTAVAPGT